MIIHVLPRNTITDSQSNIKSLIPRSSVMFQQYLQQQLLTEVSYKLNAKTVHCKILRIVLIKLINNNSGKAYTIICENAFKLIRVIATHVLRVKMLQLLLKCIFFIKELEMVLCKYFSKENKSVQRVLYLPMRTGDLFIS